MCRPSAATSATPSRTGSDVEGLARRYNVEPKFRNLRDLVAKGRRLHEALGGVFAPPELGSQPGPPPTMAQPVLDLGKIAADPDHVGHDPPAAALDPLGLLLHEDADVGVKRGVVEQLDLGEF